MKRPVKLVHIVLAVPVESESYMDILSDTRDDFPNHLIEWGKAQYQGDRIPDRIIDRDSEEFRSLFT